MRSGDISGSDDTWRLIQEGKLKVQARVRESDGVTEHVYVDDAGKTWNPIQPFSGGDY